MGKRVLIIVTSHSAMGDTGKATGVWAEELVVPYYAFIDKGIDLDLASPRGGAVPFDPASLKPAGTNPPLIERFLADPQAQERVRHTLETAGVDAAAYDAVYFPGGHGTMWDLPEDPGVRRAVEAAHGAGRFIASVCHGAAGLLSARRSDGKAVVEGRRINAFTDAEERAAGLVEVVPFKLETRLRDLGARFEGAPEWQPHVVRDDRFITGQNPQSSERVAAALIEALAA